MSLRLDVQNRSENAVDYKKEEKIVNLWYY